MAQPTTNAPRIVAPRKRVLFGLLDADGWPWAFVKGTFWFVLLIVLLGYIPDRAYYFTVQRTVDIAFPTLWWSPVNLCPPENETLPCPAPAGASLPWHPSPPELNLPAVRTDGVGAVAGTTFLYVGGSDGTAPVSTTYVSHTTGVGNISSWTQGPDLPEARADAASAVIGTTLYLIGGYGPDGQPTTTVYSLTVDNDGSLGDWETEDSLVLPAPRAGSSATTVSDGLVVMGGTDGSTATKDVWKATQTEGEFAAWVPQQPLFEENVDGVAAHIGDWIFVVGGTKGDGTPVATVQQGLVAGTTEDVNAIMEPWRVSAQTNLPSARTNAAGYTVNGGFYIQGGSDGSSPIAQTLWTNPDASGVIPEWHTLSQTDLGVGLEGASGVVSGSHAFVLGGETGTGPTAGLARANLAPQEPFFQLGLMGVVIPALQLQGEIGQQIGYLNAATVGAVNFILLIIVGWAYNRPERVREIVASIRNRRRKR
jgi:hypothetical protein